MSGRTLSGQTTEAFYVSMQHAKPICIGLNCALGADQMLPFMQVWTRCTSILPSSSDRLRVPSPRFQFLVCACLPVRHFSSRFLHLTGTPALHQALSNVAECFVHSYPNAGLPNAMGGYDETPESFAKSVKLFIDTGLVNALGDNLPLARLYYAPPMTPPPIRY